MAKLADQARAWVDLAFKLWLEDPMRTLGNLADIGESKDEERKQIEQTTKTTEKENHE